MPRTFLNTAAILVALVLALLIAVIIALLLYLQYGDINALRPRLESLISQSTGRPFRIEGQLELQLWPELFVAADGLHLANAAWASEGTMARVGHVAVQIRPGSQFRGPLELRDLQLRDLDVVVETGPAGESNWTLAAQESAEAPRPDPGDSDGAAMILQRAQFSKLRLRYIDPDKELHSGVTDTLSLLATDVDQLRLECQGAALGMPLTVSGRLGTRNRVVHTGAIDYELALVLGESRLALEGARTAPANGSPAQTTLDLRLDGLQPLMDHLEVPLNNPRPLPLAVRGRGAAALANIDIEGSLGAITLDTNIQRSGDSVTIDGRIATLARVGALFDIQGLPPAPP